MIPIVIWCLWVAPCLWCLPEARPARVVGRSIVLAVTVGAWWGLLR